MERLISAYRKDDWADAKGFTVQLGAILERYPAEVVDYVTHPLSGIQRRCKFPPSLAEVVSACESQVMASEWVQREAQLRESRERDRQELKQMAERKEAARCHLWMRSEPAAPEEVDKFPLEIQQRALRMSLNEVLEIIPKARNNFSKPIEQCREFLECGGIIG